MVKVELGPFAPAQAAVGADAPHALGLRVRCAQCPMASLLSACSPLGRDRTGIVWEICENVANVGSSGHTIEEKNTECHTPIR